MKIAVTSVGTTMDCQVDPLFGRAACFAIIDTNSETTEFIANDAASGSGGVGIAAAKTIIDAGAQIVLTGNCGPNAHRTLEAAGIGLYVGVKGTVKEAIEQFKAGNFNQTSAPNAKPHSGMSQ